VALEGIKGAEGVGKMGDSARVLALIHLEFGQAVI